MPHDSELSFDQGHLESGLTADFTDEPKDSLALATEINAESDRYLAGDFLDYDEAEMSSIYRFNDRDSGMIINRQRH